MKEIILIRHGQTDYNLEMKFMGQTDASLNDTGRNEASELAERWNEEGVKKILSSPLRRCLETASIVCPGREIETIGSLMEMDFGIFECLTYEELKKKYPEKLEAWNEDRFNYKIPEGESIADMSKRVINGFEKILNEYSGRTVIFAHSGTIRIILAHYLINSLHETWRFSVDHCRMTRLNFSGDYGYLKSLNE